MMDRQQCPECYSYDTERVHTDWFTDMVKEVRICNNCPAQIVNKYDLFEQKAQYHNPEDVPSENADAPEQNE